MMSIEDWRREIDAIDDELVRLLNKRARLAIKLGALKAAGGLSLCDRERERDVIVRACRSNRGPLDEQAIAKLFRRIIRESLLVETRAVDSGAHSEGLLR